MGRIYRVFSISSLYLTLYTLMFKDSPPLLIPCFSHLVLLHVSYFSCSLVTLLPPPFYIPTKLLRYISSLLSQDVFCYFIFPLCISVVCQVAICCLFQPSLCLLSLSILIILSVVLTGTVISLFLFPSSVSVSSHPNL